MTLDSISGLKIVSMNVNGIGQFSKRINFVTHIENLKVDVVCLIDSRLSDINARHFQNEADKFQWFFAPGIYVGNAISRGIAVGFKKGSLAIPGFLEILAAGNIAKVNFKYEGHEFALYAVYGPSDADSPMFFEGLFNDCAVAQERFKIITGDFNVPLNFKIDTFNCTSDSRKRAREKIKSKMLDFNFVDAFRKLHGNKKMYTWHNPAGTKKSRLDFFLVSSNLIPVIKKASSGIFFQSDHRLIDLFLDFSSIKSGIKRWRFTPKMRQDGVLKNVIRNEIRDCAARYLIIQDGEDARDMIARTPSSQLFELDYTLSWGDLFNVLINDVKNAIISYEAGQRYRNRSQLQKIQEEISELEDSGLDLNRLDFLKNWYSELVNIETINTLINRQEAFKIDGERPTAFFLNLERNRAAEGYIPRLREGEGWILDQVAIEDRIRSFYKDLYENKERLRNGSTIGEYLGDPGLNSAPKLTVLEAEEIDGPITLKEVEQILEKTKDRSAPGLSGVTYSFFKDFWEFFGPLLLKTIEEAFSVGFLPDYMSRGVISLLPKGNKDRTLLKNWRPITLLECSYKLLSGVLAARLNKVINKLVDPVQKGFVPNRNIAENVRTFFDVLDYANRKKVGGTAIVLDYEKAFDTLSHEYFKEVLSFFGFGPNIRKWIQICLSNFKAHTSHANNISAEFVVGRGARQGDPLSPPIFALAIEIFSIKIRSSIEAIPFSLGTLKIKLSLYADDSIVITTQDEGSVRFILEKVGEFYGLSGLKIQLQKSNMFNFGVEAPPLCPDIVIERNNKIDYLGTQFDNKLEKMDENITKKMEQIIALGESWLYRSICPLGRSTLAKSLLIPKICHILSVVKISKKVIDHFQRKIYEFIWGGPKKRHAFAREDAQVSAYEGGLDMPDLETAIKSYQISWLRRAANNTESNTWRDWLDILLQNACGLNFRELMEAGTKTWQVAASKIDNLFWKEVFKSFNKLTVKVIEKDPQSVLSMSIWNSGAFRFNNRFLNPSINRYMDAAGKLNTPLDLLGTNGNLLSAEQRVAKFGIDIHPEILEAVRGGIRGVHRSFLPNICYQQHYPFYIPFNYAIICKFVKGCSHWTRYLKRKKTQNIRNIEIKHAISLGININAQRWREIYWLVANIRYGNEIKWLIHQIIRGCLTTNTRLVKMGIRDSNLCTFCNNTPETVGHLFWDCRLVLNFLNEIKHGLSGAHIDYDLGFSQNNPYGREIFILGDNRQRSGQIPNYLYNIVKKFIWNCKCKEIDLNADAFWRFLSKRIKLDRVLVRKDKRLSFINILGDRLGIG